MVAVPVMVVLGDSVMSFAPIAGMALPWWLPFVPLGLSVLPMVALALVVPDGCCSHRAQRPCLGWLPFVPLACPLLRWLPLVILELTEGNEITTREPERLCLVGSLAFL